MEVVDRLRSLPAIGDPASVLRKVRPKSSPQLKTYAQTVATRFHGMSALKPFLQAYIDMRRKLKTSSSKVAEFDEPGEAAAVATLALDQSQLSTPAKSAAVPPPMQVSGKDSVSYDAAAQNIAKNQAEQPKKTQKRAPELHGCCCCCWKAGGKQWSS